MSDTTLGPLDQAAAGPRDAAPAQPMPQSMVPIRGWVWIGVLTFLFLGMHLPYIDRLLRIVTNAEGGNLLAVFINALSATWNPDWSHALVIPLISLYFLYLWRDQLLAAPIKTNWWGLGIMCFGLLSYTWWIFPGKNDMLQGYSLILTLFGMVLFVLGEHVMRVAWFPIAYLVFSVKISHIIWEQIAWKMQNIAAAISHVALQFLGLVFDFEAERTGNTLTLLFMKDGKMVSEAMNVAEACSGLRMLMAFIALAVALAFIAARPWWQRVLMIALAVPVAVVVNVGRVTAIGLLNLVNPEYARGDFHTFVGLLMLIPAGLLILFIAWCADRIFIHDDKTAPAPGSAAKSSAVPAQPAPPRPLNLSTTQHAAAIFKGALTGIAITLILGAAYAGVWLVSSTSLLEGMPQLTLMALMMLVLLGVAGLMALAGRVALRAMSRGLPARLPLTAGLVAGLLLTVWVGQSTVIAYTEVVLIKKSVPTRLHLMMVPQQVGPWKMLSDQSSQMSKEVVEALGTTNFISRLYMDSSVYPPGTTMETLARMNVEPGSIARLHVAYYTGNPDTVPHVPDRCYLASGMGFVDKRVVELELDETKYVESPEGDGYLAFVPSGLADEVLVPGLEIPATMFTYQPDVGDSESVIYFFMANGNFFGTAQQVRAKGFDPRDEYSYYCKIEVAMVGVSDPEENRRLTAKFLEDVLPEVLACLPDWRAVRAGHWPPAEAGAPQAGATQP